MLKETELMATIRELRHLQARFMNADPGSRPRIEKCIQDKYKEVAETVAELYKVYEEKK